MALVLAGLAACQTQPPSQSNLMREAGGVSASESELRIRIRYFAARFALLVEDAADRVVAQTDDRAVQRAAVEWKANIIAHAQTTCILADPLAALFDTWALAIQQRQFFEGEYTRQLLGELDAIPLAASEEIVQEVEDLARSISVDGDIDAGRAFVEQWAAEQETGDAWIRRDTIVPRLAPALAASNLGISETFSRVGDEVADLSLRLSMMNEFGPRQVRWQAQLLAYELGLPEFEDWAVATATELLLRAGEIATAIEGFHELVREERTIVFEQLASEREVVLSTLHGEMTRAFDQLARERETIVAELGRERALVLAAMNGELTRALEYVTAERVEVLEAGARIAEAQWPAVRDDLSELSRRSLEGTRGPLAELVDHAVLRLAQLGGAGLVGLLAVGLVLQRSSRR